MVDPLRHLAILTFWWCRHGQVTNRTTPAHSWTFRMAFPYLGLQFFFFFSY